MKIDENRKLPFITLLSMISFASVNAGLFTPGLPEIAKDFGMSSKMAQHTVTWFLIGYAVGQLVYGPLTRRFGRKTALYVGIILQILSSLLCVVAGIAEQFWLLIVGRFLVALGSGVGLKMTYIIVNETYEPSLASQKISYLMLAFSITPGLGMALGGVLTAHYGWVSCFYAGALYGLLLLGLVMRFPNFKEELNKEALQAKNILSGYWNQFKNCQLIMGGCLMGCATSFIYVFVAMAPFIAIQQMGMESVQYGMANILPQLGAIIGLLISAQFVRFYSLKAAVSVGLLVLSIGIFWMIIAFFKQSTPIVSLFLPMMVIYFGISFISANTSSILMGNVKDKAYGAAVMSFMNLSVATAVVMTSGLFEISPLLLPVVYLFILGVMVINYLFLKRAHSVN